MSLKLALTDAGVAQSPTLQQLFQLYTHDFSTYWAGLARGDLDEDGLFPAYPLAPYWTTPGWSASLIRCDGALAGFALVNDRAIGGAAIDWNVAEFFVVRKYRGQGVGGLAARQMFERQPGRWQVAVTRANIPGRHFWERTITDIAAAGTLTTVESDDGEWRGPIFYFQTAAG